jgi:eukaryotic-like serine/threonine-protein kinase
VKEAAQSPYLARFDSFEVNLRSRELCKGGERIKLPEQSFQILVMLVERPGEVVTRQEIQQKLWPNDTVVEFENSINAAIRRLRGALGDSADQPRYIETLARRGYRLKVPVEWIEPPPAEPRSLAAPTVAPTVDTSASNLIGKRVSHYRVLEILGGGGMGVVYKAEDIKLGRRVALKFLPEELAHDPAAMERFEREARAASALNHPNICTIYEVEEHEGQPFIVMELLEGRTLRELISATEGPELQKDGRNECLRLETLLNIATQIVEGLDAAHKKGIIHRDIKPANIFVTAQGQVKILDFGLAKLQEPDTVMWRSRASNANEPEEEISLNLTLTGVAMGTAGYMSPEQVRGETLDPRTDLFSFGLVLYEMAGGKRAFTGETAVAIHNAILNVKPRAVRDLNPKISPKMESIINKALEKNRELRYQSAPEIRSDLQLEAATFQRVRSASSHAFGETSSSSTASKSLLLLERFRRQPWYGVLAVATLAIVAIGLALGLKHATVSSQPVFHRLTFPAGTVLGARFVPEGRMVVYAASWEGDPVQVFLTAQDSSGSRELGYNRANILAISNTGELALGLHKSPFFGDLEAGTLAQVPLTSSEAPHEVAEHILFADWSRSGSLAIVSSLENVYQLEFPKGKVLYRNQKTIYYPRVSPDERLVAFREDQDGVWALVVVDQAGHRKTLSRGWRNLQGLAWQPSGKEIWFAAREFGSHWGLYSVALSGQQRLVWQMPDPLRLHDISSDGSVLLSKDNSQRGIKWLGPGDSQERDLSWLDGSQLSDMSSDGRLVLFTEFGESANAFKCEFCGGVYLRSTDGSAPMRLGEGTGLAISPDQKWALLAEDNFSRLVAVPIGPGEPRVLTHKPMRYWYARWFAGGDRITFTATEPGHGPRIYVQELTKEAEPLSAEGVDIDIPFPSPDGKHIACSLADRPWIWDIRGGAPRMVPHTLRDEAAWDWSSDNHFLFVGNLDSVPAEVYRVDVKSGKRTAWTRLAPQDRAGIEFVNEFHPRADERGYAYSYKRTLSELYLVTGLK